MSKQTAIDVYHAQIKYLIKMGLKLPEPDKTFLNSAYRDCKAMEREQIMNAWAYGVFSQDDKTAEQYYNETYKGDNK